uniref:Growth arrest specific 2 like 2 n=1 Tax=Piliocolobus tephrosceles TaxID=591936 RepID=A0A8C9H8V9_9PRIM
MSQPAGGRRRPGTLEPPVCSIRPFKSSEQYLEAMKEDLAEWLHDLYGLDIDSTNFLQVLETGLVLCRHANAVTDAALAFLAEAPAQAQKIPMPRVRVSCNGAAQPGTFQARDNVSNFIQWCRKEMGIQEVLMFETEDLVQRKNVKNVVLCLLELGRRAWRFGVAAPTLVQLEEEIEEEVRRELPCHFRNLDQMVQNLVSHCTCPVQFSMVKVSEGKYRVGDSNTLIFIRILRNNVMVRVGGGWDTLGHYLDKHDPCRCTSLSHKPGNFLKPPAPPVQHEVRVQDGPSQTQPTMTISRSQSPPPAVDWKTYASSGRRLRPPTPSSPRPRRERGAGTGASREMAPFLRCQERSLTPCWRQPTAGDSPPSPQSSSSQKGRGPQCTLSGKREDRDPAELPRGRIPTSWVHEKTDSQGTAAQNPTPQRPRDTEATTKGISARGLSSLPRSCSPAEQLGLRLPLQDKAKGAFFQFREPESVCSPTPVQGLTKMPIRLPSACLLAPGMSFPGAICRSPRTELGRDPIPLRAVTADLVGSTHGDCSVKVRQEDQQLDIQLMAEAKESRDLGPQEQQGRYTPLPLGRNKEQAIYCSLEEQILGNMKLLEVGSACLQGTRSGVIPRSGVYVPSLGGRWPEPGGPYDKVIQELAQGPPPLLKVDLEAWKATPTGSPKPAATPGPGSLKGKLGAIQSGPRTKASLSAKGSHMRKVPPQEGQDCLAPTASASPEAPTPPPLDPNSDKVKACLSEGRRTLRKPKRVPSIYKLKLRPRIRPRRDHRPEKQPSRIPKPLAYVCLGPARPPRGDRLPRAVLGSKRREASRVDGASVGEQEEEGKEKEPAAPLESRPQTPEDLPPHRLDQAPLPPEEESWV